MREPIPNVAERNRAQGLSHSVHQGLKRPGLGRPQSRLDFRPAQFNRVEVGRIRRQELQTGSTSFNQLPDGISGMGRQVIDDHNIAAPQGREQLRVNIGFKRNAIYGSFQNPRRLYPVPTQRGDESVMGPRIARRGFDHPLASRRPSEQARQPQMRPTFIDKFQAFDQVAQRLHELRLEVLAQGFYPRRVALAVVKRLFFRSNFNHCNSRHIMLGLATKPLTSATRSHNSFNVASGCFLTSVRMKLLAAWSVRSGPLAWGKAAQLPLACQRYHHFSNVDLWMLNRAATSAWVAPSSNAAMARARRSWE